MQASPLGGFCVETKFTKFGARLLFFYEFNAFVILKLVNWYEKYKAMSISQLDGANSHFIVFNGNSIDGYIDGYFKEALLQVMTDELTQIIGIC